MNNYVKEPKRDRDSICVLPLHIHRQTSGDLHDTGFGTLMTSEQLIQNLRVSGLKKKDGAWPQSPNIQRAVTEKMG